MIEKLDKLALSTSLSSANLCIDWPFKAFCSLFVRKGNFFFSLLKLPRGASRAGKLEYLPRFYLGKCVGT